MLWNSEEEGAREGGRGRVSGSVGLAGNPVKSVVRGRLRRPTGVRHQVSQRAAWGAGETSAPSLGVVDCEGETVNRSCLFGVGELGIDLWA